MKARGGKIPTRELFLLVQVLVSIEKFSLNTKSWFLLQTQITYDMGIQTAMGRNWKQEIEKEKKSILSHQHWS